MLQAMNTGHEGSLTTVHANSASDAFARLETMVMWAGVPLPSQAIRAQLVGAVNIVVQQSRLAGGARKIVSVSEVAASRDGDIQVQDIFVFRQTGIGPKGMVEGYFEATGIVPACCERLASFGIRIPPEMFLPRVLSAITRPATLDTTTDLQAAAADSPACDKAKLGEANQSGRIDGPILASVTALLALCAGILLLRVRVPAEGHLAGSLGSPWRVPP